MQAMENPEISGIEYQQGTLAGYELREYLLEKWARKCVYCDAENVPLQVEHIRARTNSGSDRVSNLTLACQPCNERKGARPVEDFLKTKPDGLKRVLAHAKAPLKDAAAVRRGPVGADRPAQGPLADRVRERWAHQVQPDPARFCERPLDRRGLRPSDSGERVTIRDGFRPLGIVAKGRGTRQVVRTGDRVPARQGRSHQAGFRVFDGRSGRLVQPAGKYAGVHVGRLAGIRATGQLDIATATATITASHKNFTLIQRGDGYGYAM